MAKHLCRNQAKTYFDMLLLLPIAAAGWQYIAFPKHLATCVFVCVRACVCVCDCVIVRLRARVCNIILSIADCL